MAREILVVGRGDADRLLVCGNDHRSNPAWWLLV
jgi:hypothetical protein